MKQYKNTFRIISVILLILPMLYGCKIEFPSNVQQSAVESSAISISSVQPVGAQSTVPFEETSRIEQEDSGTADEIQPSDEAVQSDITMDSSVPVADSPEENTVPEENGTPNQQTSVPENKTSAVENPPQPQGNYCTFSIRNDAIQPDTFIYPETRVEFKEGETIYDLTVRLVHAAGMQISADTFPSPYIKSINNLAQFQYGATSGWMFSINRKYINASCGSVKVTGGIKIEWWYTCDNGKDLPLER